MMRLTHQETNNMIAIALLVGALREKKVLSEKGGKRIMDELMR